MAEANPSSGPECRPRLTRREFARAVGAPALVAALPLVGPRTAEDAPGAAAPAETPVGRFYRSLNAEQRRVLCFPSDHPLRFQVRNHWSIVRPTIGDLTPDQQGLCREIFRDLCSEEGHERFQRQMKDDHGGFQNYHVALFGEPAADAPFEWVLTGRHATLRADGQSRARGSFDGPIFYGHSGNDAQQTENVWGYQGEQANRIFHALDEADRARALVVKAETASARARRLRGGPTTTGLDVGTLDVERKRMVQDLLKDLCRPFRNLDGAAIRDCLRAGGADTLRLTFFQEGDIGDDPIRDIWKLEGPGFAWYYHGSPHVHAWLNVDRQEADRNA